MITKTEPTTASTTLAQDTRFRLLLCGILIAAYMLVYVDVPATIDGKATLAVTSSLLKYGTPDINVIGSAEGLLPPMARMGSFGQDGLLYAKKGITPSLFLLPFVQLAHIIPFLPVRATAMLLNPVVTTLTALLLYTFARWIHYPPRTAFVTALTYGLGTFAVVYTLTLFGEPLAAFLLLSALMAGYYYRQSGDFRALMIAGAALGLAVGVNLSYGVMAPLIGVYAFGLDPRRWRLLQLTAMILPFSLLFVLLLAYNLARFGSLLQSGYHFAEGEGFTSPFWIGIIGLILSPYRGFFWYNPVMLLAVPGALLFRRRNLPLLSIILALTAAQIITYASWWSWHGGVVWGPRFLIPITPLLALLLLPVIDRVPQQHLLAAIFILLGGFSLLIQAAASFFRVIPFVEFQLDTSPIIAQFQLALSGEALHPALFRNSDLIHAVLLLSALAAGILGFHYAKRGWHVSAAAAVMILAVIGVAGRQQQQMEPAVAVAQQLLPADMVIAASDNYSDSLINLKVPVRIVATHAPTLPDDPLASGLWNYAMQQTGLTWFITWFPAASSENWQERDLWQRASFVRETSFRENRALLFDLHPPARPDQRGGWQFGQIQLARYGIQRDPDGVRASLVWQSEEPPEQDYIWFVHLIDSNGQIVQQQDRAPQGGYSPTSTWEPGQTVTDYLFFPVPPNTDTSGWQLRVGWVDPVSNTRLPIITPANETIPDGLILLPSD